MTDLTGAWVVLGLLIVAIALTFLKLYAVRYEGQIFSSSLPEEKDKIPEIHLEPEDVNDIDKHPPSSL